MIRYQCHKIVEAFDIEKIKPVDSLMGNADLVSSNGNCVVRKDRAWMKKHDPQVGGYFVRYTDGYESYSPADAFEAGYSVFKEAAELNFMQRVEIEKAELDEKINSLKHFLAADVYPELPDYDQENLLDQLQHMGHYADVLTLRIASFSESTPRLSEDIAADGPTPEVQPYGQGAMANDLDEAGNPKGNSLVTGGD